LCFGANGSSYSHQHTDVHAGADIYSGALGDCDRICDADSYGNADAPTHHTGGRAH
jgi:hypothetical protein